MMKTYSPHMRRQHVHGHLPSAQRPRAVSKRAIPEATQVGRHFFAVPTVRQPCASYRAHVYKPRMWRARNSRSWP